MRRSSDLAFASAFSLLLGLSVWAVQTARWEARHWDNLTMYEAVNQLSTPITGTGSEIIGDFLGRCVMPGIVAALLAAAVLYKLRDRACFARLAQAGTMLLGAFVLGMLAYGWDLLGVGDYLRDSSIESTYIEYNYVDPRTVRLTFPERKRNLIYIWLESMESTFADEVSGGAFPKNVIPELTALAESGESFTGTRGGVNGAYSVTGTSWTMGALFAQTSGLPLKIPLSETSMDSQETFFPGVTTLGDILAENGYRQAFLLGSSAEFAGRDLYFREHGDYTIWDYDYSIAAGELPEDYYVWWGYEDEKLFEFAKRHLTELAASDEPFNLSILTVDTHFPDGWVCGLCEDEFDDRYSNVMACSSRQVAGFVAWLEQQPFYENTTVVICGDHITMNVGYCDGIDPVYRRHAYTTILNGAAEAAAPEQFREFSSMDLFPTTLAALGVKIKGSRLGLGVNLYSSTKTLVERDGFDEVDAQLRRRSEFMDGLSGLSEETLAMTEALRTLDTQPAVEFRDDGLDCTFHNLAPYAGDIHEILVFADAEHHEQETTLSMQAAQPRGGDGWGAFIPLEDLEGYDAVTVRLYATTAAGRIPTDMGYLCDLRAQTVTRLGQED